MLPIFIRAKAQFRSRKKTNEVAEWLGDIYYDQMEKNVGQETVQNEFREADCISPFVNTFCPNFNFRTCQLNNSSQFAIDFVLI